MNRTDTKRHPTPAEPVLYKFEALPLGVAQKGPVLRRQTFTNLDIKRAWITGAGYGTAIRLHKESVGKASAFPDGTAAVFLWDDDPDEAVRLLKDAVEPWLDNLERKYRMAQSVADMLEAASGPDGTRDILEDIPMRKEPVHDD